MPTILIKSIEYTTKVNPKSGKANSGCEVKGVKLIDQYNKREQPFEKFYYDFNGDAEKFEGFKAGQSVHIACSKDPNNPRFWVVDSVEEIGTPARQEPQSGPAVSTGTTKGEPKKTQQRARSPEILIRTDACRLAVELGASFIANGRYKKTATTEFILQDILNSAQKFNDFLSGKSDDPLVSSPADLEKKGQKPLPLDKEKKDTEQPDGDEDPREAMRNDNSDIPF